MKKNLLFVYLLFSFITTSNAQNLSKNALGLRLGNNDGFGAEFSYQRALSSSNRAEIDLGWQNSNNVSAIKLTGLYQWVWQIDNGLNWYAGAGAGIISWSNSNHIPKDSGILFNAAGDIGLEYSFNDTPIQISLDLRPELYFATGGYRNSNFGNQLALGVRYKFD
jgi:opacity protein-like surface antigen